MRTDAVISPDGLYRYQLTRHWGPGPACVFIMLNPSTADDTIDDPTIRRCISFAQREGCGRLIVVNLFAYRATDPDTLLTADDPEGPLNDHYLQTAIRQPDATVIAAWGAWWDTHQGKVTGKNLARLAPEGFARSRGITLWCLGTTKSGAPKHPLYIKTDQPLERFP